MNIQEESAVAAGAAERQSNPLLYCICTVTLALIFALDLTIPLGVAVGVLYVTVLLLTLLTQQNKITLIVASLSSMLIIHAFFHKAPVSEMWKVVFNRGISLFVVWATAILGMQRNKAEQQRSRTMLEREEALAEVRTLRGFLPICASCKKIRDDNGIWTQMEGYIRAHTEAEFTHSICPDCAERLYPGFNKPE